MKRQTRARKTNLGFTLLETVIALALMAIGVLGLAAMLANALQFIQGTQADFIAQQKAEEAVEAIYTAKYNGNIGWSGVANYDPVNSPAGVFLVGPQPLLQPGPDGLVGSAADAGVAQPDYILLPGPDGIMGTADDIQVSLGNYTRTIVITGVAGVTNLRQIAVTVNYTVGKFNRSYTVNSYISAF